MALIQCRECGNQISTNAAICPACGNPTHAVKVAMARRPSGCLMLGLLLIPLIVVFKVFDLVENGWRSDDAAPAVVRHWELIGSQGIMRMAYMEPAYARDAGEHKAAIAAICGTEDICSVIFWTDRDLVPRSLPMSDAQLAAVTAQWKFNRHTHYSQMMWPCAVVNDPKNCF